MTRRALMLFVFGLMPAAPVAAQEFVAETFPEGTSGGAVSPNYSGAGAYAPSTSGSAVLMLEGTANSDNNTGHPDIRLSLQSVAWADFGNEPAVFVRASAFFSTAAGANVLLRPPQATAEHGAGYLGPPRCRPNLSNLCEEGTNPGYRTLPSAAVRQPYRVRNTTPNMLPSGVNVIPLKVDYAIWAHTSGRNANASGTVSMVATDDNGNSRDQRVSCNARDGCGATGRGTMDFPIGLEEADGLQLGISAGAVINDKPECEERMLQDGTVLCVVDPYSANSRALVDPYVYVDPQWQYADWFVVEATQDGNTWHEAVRTPFDPAAFDLLDGAGGTGGSGGLDGGTPDAGNNGTGGSAGTGGEGGGSGGGCTVGQPKFNDTPWFVFAFAVLVAMRPRAS